MLYTLYNIDGNCVCMYASRIQSLICVHVWSVTLACGLLLLTWTLAERAEGRSRAVACPSLVAGAGHPRVRGSAFLTRMGVSASRVTAPAVVKPAAYRRGMVGGVTPAMGEPAQPWAVGVLRALLPCVVILQAKVAPGDVAGTSCEGLIVQARVCDGPVQILAGQCLSTELSIIGHPAT